MWRNYPTCAGIFAIHLIAGDWLKQAHWLCGGYFRQPNNLFCDQLLISYNNPLFRGESLENVSYLTPVIDFADQVARNSQK